MDTLRTLFLNPPSYSGFDGGAGARYQARREIRSFWYPTWLAQPAALIPNSKLIDAPADDLTLEQTLLMAKGFELCIIHTSTPSFENDVRVAERLKQDNPRLKIGFVGAHVAVLPEQSLKASAAIDFVAREEFDYTLLEVAQGKPLSEIDGLSYRKGDEVAHNKDRALIDDMDALPDVVDVYKRDLTPENYYIGYLKHPYVSLYTGRGCPARCTFCLWPQTVGGHVYRTRSPERVIAEMAKAKALFPQAKEFFFDDDTFTADLPRAAQIAKGLGKLGITWSCNSRANVPYEYLKVFKENGLRLLLVGYESGNQQILNNIKKGIRIDIAREFTRNCRKLGIVIHGTFILGLPGETKKTIQETMRFACDLDVETIQVSLAAPYPGTELYRQAMANNWFKKDALVRNDGTQSVTLQYEGLSSEDINKALNKMYSRYYFRPRPIGRILKAMAKDPQERTRRLREGKEFLRFLWGRPAAAGSAGAAA
ncbi:MAG TPA: hopanoid biosynthesis associated radical SAM protein HpnJ [Elusimicrobiota bacterium]|jgi:hopanoid biosynthesis associated radical SAM protein HpnJ|nr:hopanoid biosynthesis associated radical SAM protein HpnJ [Elusimicrobiota bacterium]